MASSTRTAARRVPGVLVVLWLVFAVLVHHDPPGELAGRTRPVAVAGAAHSAPARAAALSAPDGSASGGRGAPAEWPGSGRLCTAAGIATAFCAVPVLHPDPAALLVRQAAWRRCRPANGPPLPLLPPSSAVLRI